MSADRHLIVADVSIFEVADAPTNWYFYLIPFPDDPKNIRYQMDRLCSPKAVSGPKVLGALKVQICLRLRGYS